MSKEKKPHIRGKLPVAGRSARKHVWYWRPCSTTLKSSMSVDLIVVGRPNINGLSGFHYAEQYPCSYVQLGSAVGPNDFLVRHTTWGLYQYPEVSGNAPDEAVLFALR